MLRSGVQDNNEVRCGTLTYRRTPRLNPEEGLSNIESKGLDQSWISIAATGKEQGIWVVDVALRKLAQVSFIA